MQEDWINIRGESSINFLPSAEYQDCVVMSQRILK